MSNFNTLLINEVNKEVARKLNLPYKDVEEILKFYFSKIERRIIESPAVNVIVPNIGTFVIQKHRLNKIFEAIETKKLTYSESVLARLSKTKQNIETNDKLLFKRTEKRLKKSI